EAIRAREREFRTLAEHTPDFIVRWDRELRRVYVNPAFAAAMGTAPEQLVDCALGNFPAARAAAPATSIEAVRASIQRVLVEEKPCEILVPWTTVAGDTFHYLRFIPEYDGSGKLVT